MFYQFLIDFFLSAGFDVELIFEEASDTERSDFRMIIVDGGKVIDAIFFRNSCTSFIIVLLFPIF